MAEGRSPIDNLPAGPGRISVLEQKLGLKFHDPDLLQLALTHSSFANENPDGDTRTYERLEYLGDALIDLVIASELYDQHPDWGEGQLTTARASVVRRETLAVAGRSLELGQHLRMGRGEEASGGRDRESTMAAAFEAVVGAVLLDGGYEAARGFALQVLSPELNRVRGSVAGGNPKSSLQEAVQSRGSSPPTYSVVETSGQDHARKFTVEVAVDGLVVGRGTGSRKLLAEQEAALKGLLALEREAPGPSP